jgi:hypothetical protein
MNRNTPDQIAGSMVPVYGEFHVEVVRADGTREDKGWFRNIVTQKGLNRIANRAVQATGTTPFYILGVGSFTSGGNPASLGTDYSGAGNGFGELSRKASTVSGASAQSKEWIFMVATWAGAADAVTSKTIDSAAILDHASSGQGIIANVVQGLGVTLADSDFLNLTARIRVGSHNLAHTT